MGTTCRASWKRSAPAYAWERLHSTLQVLMLLEPRQSTSVYLWYGRIVWDRLKLVNAESGAAHVAMHRVQRPGK